MVPNIIFLDLVHVLRSLENAEELKRLLRIIELTTLGWLRDLVALRDVAWRLVELVAVAIHCLNTREKIELKYL